MSQEGYQKLDYPQQPNNYQNTPMSYSSNQSQYPPNPYTSN